MRPHIRSAASRKASLEFLGNYCSVLLFQIGIMFDLAVKENNIDLN